MQQESEQTGERGREPGNQRPGFWRVVFSVLAAFFGVQSNKNRERDFTAGRPSAYIFIGLSMALALVLIIFGLVRLITRFAGV